MLLKLEPSEDGCNARDEEDTEGSPLEAVRDTRLALARDDGVRVKVTTTGNPSEGVTVTMTSGLFAANVLLLRGIEVLLSLTLLDLTVLDGVYVLDAVGNWVDFDTGGRPEAGPVEAVPIAGGRKIGGAKTEAEASR